MAGKEILLSIASEDQVVLEAKLKQGDKKDICFIFTHPYGPLGGSFDHPVICCLYNYFAHQGYMTVKFNFRGVGNSTGKTSYTGSGEKQDLQAVINFVKRKSDLSPTYFVMVGYSYGCIPIGALCAEMPECIGLIAISYPAGVSWALTLWNSRKFANAMSSISNDMPILFIMGDQDNFTSVAVLEKFVKSISKNASINIVSDMDHFWVGREENLLGHIKQWMHKNLDLKSYLKSGKDTPKSTEYIVEKDTSSKITLASRSSFPSTDKKLVGNEVKHPKRHSIDSQNYSKCQEAIEAVDKLLLEDFIDPNHKTHSLNAIRKNKVIYSDSLSTISGSTHSLKPLERPTRPPPAVPSPRFTSDPSLTK